MMLLADTEGSSSLLEWLQGYGSSHWLLMVMLALATFTSEDLACICGGLLAAQGWLSIVEAISACAVGIWCGDMGLYWIGYMAANTRKHWKWMDRVANPKRIAKGRRLFEEHGMKWVFVSRFVPGMRLPSFVAAGAVGWSFKKFVIALALGAWMWTPVICGLAYVFGRAVLEWVESYQRWAWPIIIGLVLLVWVMIKVVVPSFTWRGRRLLRSRWTRLRRWEFWPVWAVYPPVLVVLLWQALRHRAVAMFTACNPGMPHSGFAMESKGGILDSIHSSAPERIRCAAYERLAGGDEDKRLAAVEEFAGEHGWPLVLKPDVGERGQGVAVVRDGEMAEAWLKAYRETSIVQEYVGGVEYGVQWMRELEGEGGRITSIAGKHPQRVVGDGVKTLEELILADDRALLMADYYLAKYEDQREEVPAEGEERVLVELGTHARGAVFTDERELVTEEMEGVFARLGAELVGLGCGRYDVKVPSVEEFRAGRGMVILELNGVSGEPAHIYQPGYAWWSGMRDLCGHWERACDLGARNVREGLAEPTSLGELWALVREHRRQEWFEADVLLKKKEEDEAEE
ncbi:MAG: VTT domain-containing protein [Verrucomicrobia bacterium]|nr:VTT domain-containing protein [Verrucomicrobiota bacterium]